MTRDSFLINVKILVQMHKEGLLGGEVMPEDVLLGIVCEEDLPDVLTLGMCLNYQRNSYSLWQAVANAYQEEGSRWVFDPRVVSNCSLDDLREALLHHRVALQPNRHPEIWQRVATGITRSSRAGNVRGLLESAHNDIFHLQQIMQHTRKTDFPYLSGPKIFHYWLYVLESYAGIDWKSRELITIAPDTHVMKATVQLGLCPPTILQGTANDRQTVAAAWEAALADSDLAPIDVHTPLWLWSRAGFPALTCVGVLK